MEEPGFTYQPLVKYYEILRRGGEQWRALREGVRTIVPRDGAKYIFVKNLDFYLLNFVTPKAKLWKERSPHGSEWLSVVREPGRERIYYPMPSQEGAPAVSEFFYNVKRAYYCRSQGHRAIFTPKRSYKLCTGYYRGTGTAT